MLGEYMGDKDEGNFRTTSKDVFHSIVLWFENKYSVAIQSLCLIKKIVFFRLGTLIEIMVTATLKGHVEFIMFLYFACKLSANFQVYVVAYWRCCILAVLRIGGFAFWRCCIFSPNSKFMHFN